MSGWRFRLLEVVRQYAQHRLDTAGEAAELRTRQADHFLDVLEALVPTFDRTDETAVYLWFASELDNASTVLDTLARTGRWDDYATLARVFLGPAAAFAPSLAAVAMARMDGHPATDPALRAEVAMATKYVAEMSLDPRMVDMAQAGLDAAEAAGNEFAAIINRNALALAFGSVGPAAVEPMMEETLDQATALGNEWALIDTYQKLLVNRGGTGGDVAAVGRTWACAAPLLSGGPTGIASATAWNLYATTRWYAGDLRGAREAVEKPDAWLREVVRFAPGPARALRHSLLGSQATFVRSVVASYSGLDMDDPAELEAALTLARREQQHWSKAMFGQALGLRLLAAGDPGAGEQVFTELANDPAMSLFPFLATAAGVSGALCALAAGDLVRARQVLTPPADMARICGFLWIDSQARICIGWVELLEGDPDAALATAHDALAAAAQRQFRILTDDALELLATVLGALGDHQEGVRLGAAALRGRSDLGVQLTYGALRARFDAELAGARDALGNDAYAAAFAQGERLDLDAAVTYAARARGERGRPKFGWSSLTSTEAQVADLAAQGLTNAQVGERLLMSKETVKTHLGRVFTKLGIANRTELAAELHRRHRAEPD